jgi:hypothetical protein
VAGFDPTLKMLVETSPSDWLTLAGLPVGPARLIDAELASVSRLADKVLSVEGAEPYLCHLEFVSGHDAATLPPDLNARSALLEARHDLPVCSVVIVLRPEADSPRLTGMLQRAIPGRPPYRHFGYEVIRLWQQDSERLVKGGAGTLPLAPVGDVTEGNVPAIIERMRDRLRSPGLRDQAGELWAATHILLGLRFSDAVAGSLLSGVLTMEESTTYQAIIQKGRDQGVAQGAREQARRTILRQGTNRFGAPPPAVAAALDAADLALLDDLSIRILSVNGWADLLPPEAPPTPRPRRRRRNEGS